MFPLLLVYHIPMTMVAISSMTSSSPVSHAQNSCDHGRPGEHRAQRRRSPGRTPAQRRHGAKIQKWRVRPVIDLFASKKMTIANVYIANTTHIKCT